MTDGCDLLYMARSTAPIAPAVHLLLFPTYEQRHYLCTAVYMSTMSQGELQQYHDKR